MSDDIKNEPYESIVGLALSGSLLTIGILFTFIDIYRYSYLLGFILILFSIIGFLIEYNNILKRSSIKKEYTSDITTSVSIGAIFVLLWYFSPNIPKAENIIKILILLIGILPLFGFYKGIAGILYSFIKNGKSSDGLDLLLQVVGILIAFTALILTI